MGFIYSYPSPRVMSARAATDRFANQFGFEDFETEFVQLWAVSYEEAADDDGDDILSVLCADVNEHYGYGQVIEMPRSEFELLVPLATLFNTPADATNLDRLPEWFHESSIVEMVESDEETPAEVVETSEGEKLGQQWRSGEEPMFETFEYLRQALLMVPAHLATTYVDVCRLVLSGERGDDGVERIASMCDALAQVIEKWKFADLDDHT